MKAYHAFLVSHVAYAFPFLKLSKVEIKKIDVMLRKGLKTALGLPNSTSNKKLEQLWLHNTAEETFEAQRTAQITRLSTTQAGHRILRDAGIRPIFQPEEKTKLTNDTVGALLLSAGLVALLRPELEISHALLDDDSGRPPAEVAGFYVVSGCMLLLIATLGCGGSCGERYGWMVVYVSVLSLVTVALVVYLGLQLDTCIKERVCTKNFDVNSRRHWSILVQALAVFVLVCTKNFDVNSRRHWSILVQALAVFVLVSGIMQYSTGEAGESCMGVDVEAFAIVTWHFSL
ncbi:hypothetical protein HPB50_025331 [Hyalomma asiaticum]|uniref:Uncharacterized protein n=1 Tax=Hyalomma asiaticum TaxID=266040 RepID=A0ACB7SSL4_HYAAI|nr:hypothetical protein HPB50_025331 [Hyalomma asiaticum]